MTLYFAMCVSALKSKRMERSRGDLAFTSNGFKNWKDATISFKNHEASASHKEALQLVMVIPATCSDVGEMLSREHAQEKSKNRQCLIRILSNIHFLSRQGLALRGDGDVTFDLVYIIVLYMCMGYASLQYFTYLLACTQHSRKWSG